MFAPDGSSKTQRWLICVLVAPARSQPSSPFLSRELNGEVLLDELDELRGADVPQRQLDECAQAMRALGGSAAQSAAQVRQLANERFAQHAALASLLRRWATRLKHEVDGPLLAAHFERLAMVGGAMSAVRRAAQQLPPSSR